MKRHAFVLTAAATALAVSLGRAQTAAPASPVDAVFARWNQATPGCAVGVGVDGKAVLERGYGMADLEHDVPNAADTIFEAGSVAKQFTAAAVLLLARDAKLSLDDPVRKHVPELPAYGVPLTIRHMLTHTSGLRDWGEVAAIAGWPRGRRVHTHAHVLDIVSRQKALNFTPGSNWSYTNTGYNLSAIIVARVSGQSFADFSRDRIFKPLGMTRTSWRDDYTRIVKHRAVAYEPSTGGYREAMPFENVHGNGGLLTTAGICCGGMRTSRRGVREVSHSGATAGYRALLVRYPDQRVSVAVLCNAADANPTQYARAVAQAYVGPAFTAAAPSAGGRGEAAAAPFKPTTADLAAYPGRYVSGEAEVEFVVASDRDELVLKRRPDTVLPMRPVARDVFSVPTLGTVTFHRRDGGIVELSVKLDRVWDLRFARTP